jgi:hypothetical protein
LPAQRILVADATTATSGRTATRPTVTAHLAELVAHGARIVLAPWRG